MSRGRYITINQLKSVVEHADYDSPCPQCSQYPHAVGCSFEADRANADGCLCALKEETTDESK